MNNTFGIFTILYDRSNLLFTLKTGLNMRPVYYKTDENSMAHLSLVMLAYQMVCTIRHQLKAIGINHNRSHIVRIMNSQKAVAVTMQDKNDKKIFIRICSRPEPKVTEIYYCSRL